MNREQITNQYLEIRGCKIKRSYTDKKKAKEVAKRMSRQSNDGRLRAYSCRYCECYHVGHIRIPTPERKQEQRNLEMLKNSMYGGAAGN